MKNQNLSAASLSPGLRTLKYIDLSFLGLGVLGVIGVIQQASPAYYEWSFLALLYLVPLLAVVNLIIFIVYLIRHKPQGRVRTWCWWMIALWLFVPVALYAFLIYVFTAGTPQG